MTRREIVMLGTWAIAGFALTLAVFWPGSLDADPPATTPKIAQPTLLVDGCSLSVRQAENHALELVAFNPTKESVKVDCKVQGSSMSPMSRMSRVAMPSLMWKQDITITLAPGETKTVALENKVGAAPGGNVTITLTSGKQSIVAYQSTVPLLQFNGRAQVMPAAENLQLNNGIQSVQMVNPIGNTVGNVVRNVQ